MGFIDRLSGIFRDRGVLAERPNEEEVEVERPRTPTPTPTGRPIKRPEPTPTTHMPEAGGTTAGTPSYGSPKNTPSTQRLHNPRHF
ncbi:MAG: hypothetical protein QOG09_1456 [Solirubrobacterales bacterium]|jgi:hypothetical protein|nr:hypothetical protein [Solirubrobacterales bacterium]MDX6652200.1 hypothetical protein [Solirubrobacterales bacterium]MDX6663354.1 hypothetical protein [Solirubrobacterales bacterium]